MPAHAHWPGSEIASTGRAGCQNTECKKGSIKILKGELRLGTFVTIQDNQTWRWKHWGCVTPKQLDNIKDSTDNNLDYLDGLDELPEYDQDRVRKAFEDGHVADEDWRGDVEMNRPGMNGYRTPAHKKQMKEEEKERKAQQNEEAEEPEATPSKSAPQKRSRGKIDPEDLPEDAGPASKKTKRGKKVKEEVEINNDVDHDVPECADRQSKKTSAVPQKKTTKVKSESTEEDASDAKPAPQSKKPSAVPRKKTTKVKSESTMQEDASDTKPAPKSKAVSKKGSKAAGQETKAEAAPPSQPAKRGRKRADGEPQQKDLDQGSGAKGAAGTAQPAGGSRRSSRKKASDLA